MQRINPRSDSYEALLWDVVTNAHRYIPKPKDNVLDLGAHFGMFALYCAARGAKVFAWEPTRESFLELVHTMEVAVEIGQGGVFPINMGVWSTAGIKQIACVPETSGSNSFVRSGEYPSQGVWCATLHEILEFWDGRWQCVKMDIEGSEYEVLKSASAKDLQRIEFLTLELHNDILTREQCKEVDSILRSNFSKVEVLPVKVQGQPTDQVCAYYCWR